MSDKHDKPCPKCGHCPTCGRSNHWNPVYPYQRYPWPWPYNQPLVTYTQQTQANQIGGGGVQWGQATYNNAAAN